MNVIVDAGPVVHQNAGLARYADQLITQLHKQEQDRLTLNLFYNQHSDHRLPRHLQTLPHKMIKQGQYPWRIGVLASQLMKASFYRKSILGSTPHPQIYHATEHLLPYLRCPTVLTIHDLIFETLPEHHTRRNRLFLKLAVPRFVDQADAIIAVTNSTKQDLMRLYGTPAEKIHVIYEGIDEQFVPAAKPTIAQIQATYSPNRPYLLMVGTLEPRKNHATAMRALARLKAAGLPHRLLVVGGKGWLFEPVLKLVERLGLQDDVRFTGYVPQDDLAPLYSGAESVLVPSLYEGFGFSVLEAMACGAPVICSDSGSLPEVAGDAARIVSATDDEQLAAEILRLIAEPRLKISMRNAGIAHARRFRWDLCVRQTADLYREVLEQARFNVVQQRERGTREKSKRGY